MFYTGDSELRAIEERNLRLRRRVLGGCLRRLARVVGRAFARPGRATAHRLVAVAGRRVAAKPGDHPAARHPAGFGAGLIHVNGESARCR